MKSLREVEIKLRLDDRAAFQRRLAAQGARRLHRVHEMNALYDTPRKALGKRGCLLRLRREQVSPRGPIRSLLTFKGPAQRAAFRSANRYKVRKEMELVVADPNRFHAILAGLGLRPVFTYEKYRTTYRIPRIPRLKLELDETPIGDFAELEGPAQAIDRAARLLGYAPADYITASYGLLYIQHCRRLGVRPIAMVFSSRKK